MNKNIRILIIEDDPSNMALETYILKHEGYEILTAMTGEDGVSLALKEVPDLVISDIKLPKMTGYEVVKALKADSRFSSIPIIAVTASVLADDREKIFSSGFTDCVNKPITPISFLEKIKTHLKKGHES